MSAIVPDDRQLDTILRRGVADIIVEDEFVSLLKAGKPLRLKFGLDPSAPDIHMGHAVPLRKLRQLQELGHQVVLIVGDWTARIGDPSGESATRPMLTAEQVLANAETYMAQFFKVVDREKTEVRWQTEWFGNFSLEDVIRLTSRFTVAQLLKRDDFATRFQADRPIAITELLYPLLQAYDSVMVESDVELGGTDQRFNILLGRELQQMSGQRPQQVMLVPLLVGTDGVQKMSKSLGNYIGVTEPLNDMYGKAMSIADSMIVTFFELLTDVPDEELAEFRRQLESGATNPIEIKKRLAGELVRQFHGDRAVADAQSHFERVIQRKEEPDEVEGFAISFSAPGEGPNSEVVAEGLSNGGVQVHTIRLVVKAGLAPSNSEARRLLRQGAVRVGGRQLAAGDTVVTVMPETTIRVGNRRFIRVVNED